nr:hypothetical protein [Citromicrobium sp.]|tara:strand:+ start:93408 stop:94160 length:753 start_codon:yes stop_codon:yes gene_type:complete
MKGAIALGTGDAVRAIDASTDEAGAAFLHPHDRNTIRLSLQVERADGRSQDGGFVTLFGATSLRLAPPHEAFERMAARLCSMLGLAQLNDYPLPHFAARRNGLVEEAAYFLRTAESRGSDLCRWLDELQDEGDSYGNDMARDAINAAALAGYLLARSETDLAEPALDEKARRDKVLEGGRLALKDYDGRRVRAQEIWEKHPAWTINKVATDVARELGKDKASVMASLWAEVPETSPSYKKALEKVRAGKA